MNQTQVIICIGCGGVGKTTVSAGLGFALARLGYKTLVLTIDPSQRLATTLGIQGKKEVTRVPSVNLKGELYASIIDHQHVFEEFIKRASGQGADVSALFKNKLYQQMSTNLSGSQEFTALEKLYSCYESEQFDWIILDTPPAKHAIDFLNAPQKLAALFNESVAKWLRTPETGAGWFSQVLSAGTKQVINALENLTGSEFIKELRMFFTYIQKWQQKLENRIVESHELLVSPQTQFYLVTGLDEVKLEEAIDLGKEIKKQGYRLERVIVNKSELEEPLGDLADKNDFTSAGTYQEYCNLRLQFSQWTVLKSNLLHKFKSQWADPNQIITLKDYLNPISDVENLNLIALSLEEKILLKPNE